MKRKPMVVLHLWELIMAKIGIFGLHLLISLHSPWTKIRRKWTTSRGWLKDIGNPCWFHTRKVFLQERVHVGETINSVFSFELIFNFSRMILSVT